MMINNDKQTGDRNKLDINLKKSRTIPDVNPTRYHIIKSLFQDLLGPRNGSDEEISVKPYDQYTVGILRSIHEISDQSSDPSDKYRYKSKPYEKDLDNEDETDDTYIIDSDLNPKEGARSMGMSFVISGSEPKIKICCTWGRYKMDDHNLTWKRLPNFCVSDILDLSKMKQDNTIRAGSGNERITKSGVEIRVVKNLIGSDRYHVSVFLVNRTPVMDTPQQEDRVFQPQIRVRLHGDSKIENLGEYVRGSPTMDDLMFRDRSNKGRGHLCGVIWREIDPEQPRNGLNFSKFTWPDSRSDVIPDYVVDEFKYADIRTEFFPTYTILQPDLSDNVLERDALEIANLWNPSDIDSCLSQIPAKYNKWIADQKSSLTEHHFDEKMASLAGDNLVKCEEASDRIRKGIDLLKDNERARLAFCFMNQVMADKKRWDNRNGSDGDKKLYWYEFQMAFILHTLHGVLPGKDTEKEVCDLLWFPTGGGKTEAYLGLMIFAFSYRRLLEVDGLETDGGVSALSRYTLRLLTIQQFTRALGAITAADMRRKTNWKPTSAKLQDPKLVDKFEKSSLWGKSKFSLGVWIGNLTPNKFPVQGTPKYDILNAEGMLLPEYKRRRFSRSDNGQPAQITSCPCCGEILAILPTNSLGKYAEITWIIKSNKSIESLEAIPNKNFSSSNMCLQSAKPDKPAKSFFTISDNTSENSSYYGMRVQLHSKAGSINEKNIEDWWRNCALSALGYTSDDDPLQSSSPSKPGYFFLYMRGENKPFDFAIYCPNPKCEINSSNIFSELSTIPEAEPFSSDHKSYIHFSSIPAFTIDEQIYSRCPTVVVATVDKFARLPYEPRIASIFGNVDMHDPDIGYFRENLNGIGKAVNRFMPPSLIIQDELHLIEGPLGSMVGIYEMAIDILASNPSYIPKYVASTATIREAKEQVGTIYRKDARIFPPRGISHEDSYFSKIDEDPSCMSERHGRLYLGVLAPKGSLIVPVKVWASILSSIHRMKQNPEQFGIKTCDVVSNLDWYMTLVGYFNALKELAIAQRLFADDIKRDVELWSPTKFYSASSNSHITLKPSITLAPVEVKFDTMIYSVSVYCDNKEGNISIAVYDSNGDKPGKIIYRSNMPDEIQKCDKGENEIILKTPLSVTRGSIIWVAVHNDSENTIFHTGVGTRSCYSIKFIKIEDGGLVFPDSPQVTDHLPNMLKVSVKTMPKMLDAQKVMELSSKTNSTDLPDYIEKLSKKQNNTIDCLFTTSMFGTGIDIDRLGLMAVMGQPKSTSSYIQSTGRVGRKCAGLVVTWLRAGRVRDLSHYENFIGYHRAIHRYVEPISASPFSRRALDTCLGPVLVGVMRNAKTISDNPVSLDWAGTHGPHYMVDHRNDSDMVALKDNVIRISSSKYVSTNRSMDKDDAKEIFDNTVAEWWRIASTLKKDKKDLVYNEYSMIKKPKKNVVLGSEQHELEGKDVVYRNARNSLRDIESTFTIGIFGDSEYMRPSQYVTTYGSGAIIDNAVIPSVEHIISSLQRIDSSILDKFTIDDNKMKKIIKNSFRNYDGDIGILQIPSNSSLGVKDSKSLFQAKIFPQWMICSEHRGPRILLNQTTSDGNLKCPRCNSDGLTPRSSPVRFIQACNDGHMDDIDWVMEVHSGTECQGTIFEWHETDGSSNFTVTCYGYYDDRGKFNRTNCGKKTTYYQIRNKSSNNSLNCSRMMQEHGHSNNTCTQNPRLILRNAGNLFVPDIISSVSIPEYPGRLYESLYRYRDRLLSYIVDDNISKNTLIEEINKFQKLKPFPASIVADIKYANEDEIKEVFHQIKTTIENDVHKSSLDYEDAIIHEFLSLRKASDEGFPPQRNGIDTQFHVEPTDSDMFYSDDFELFFKITPIRKLTVTTVQIGYSREIVTIDKSDKYLFKIRNGKLVYNYHTENQTGPEKRWFVGNQLHGEGLFIQICDPNDTQKYADPLAGKNNLESFKVWNDLYTNRLQGDKRSERLTNPRFIWWHSLSHRIINQISVDSGFSSSSIGERIYCRVNPATNKVESGILLFTAQAGGDGTLGGLISLTPQFKTILAKIANEIRTCSNDPVCSERHRNSNRFNGVACHACMLISETSCDVQNRLLDRGLLIESMRHDV